MLHPKHLLALLPGLVIAGCGSDESSSEKALADSSTDSIYDASVDSRTETGPIADASVDSTLETSSDAADASSCKAAPLRAMWIWEGSAVTDGVARADLFAFAGKNGVNRIFLQGNTASDVLTKNLMQGHPAELSSFLGESAKRCIGVELLFGKSTWALEDQHNIAVGLAQQLVAFNKGLSQDHPIGIHFDVEAHGIHGVMSGGKSWDWSTSAQRAPMVAQYLGMLSKVSTQLAGSGLALTVDIPFWYDSSSFNPVTYEGKTAAASEHLLGIVDVATIMDYRDSLYGTGKGIADSSDGIYDLAQTEIAYAGTKGKKVIVGFETGGCETINGTIVLTGELEDLVTFCDEGRAQMESSIATLLPLWEKSPGFAGFAIHHYGSWKEPGAMAP